MRPQCVSNVSPMRPQCVHKASLICPQSIPKASPMRPQSVLKASPNCPHCVPNASPWIFNEFLMRPKLTQFSQNWFTSVLTLLWLLVSILTQFFIRLRSKRQKTTIRRPQQVLKVQKTDKKCRIQMWKHALQGQTFIGVYVTSDFVLKFQKQNNYLH